MPKNIIIFLLISLLMTSACDDCVFISRNVTTVAIRFYSRSNQKLVKKPIRYVFDSIQTAARGMIQKDCIINSLQSNLTVNLPLHPYEDNSKFYVITKVKNGTQITKKKDSISFTYQRNFAVVSPRCGYDQRIDNLTIGATSYDSVVMFKQGLEVNDTVNVRIYLK
jgi:hypothetical protein